MINLDQNWDRLIRTINAHIAEPRRGQLLQLYTQYEERMKKLPASTKTQFHSAFEGGYIFHVLNVITLSVSIEHAWLNSGVTKNWSDEELIFSALNHDLGKIGDESGPLYYPNDSEWHIKNQGALYKFNDSIPFMAVHDRSLFILQQHGIPCSFNETLAIRLHGGLWDEGAKEYLSGYNKPNTALPYILHQADLAAARIEYEQQYLNIPKVPKVTEKKIYTKKAIQQDILSSNTGAEGLQNTLKNL
jgi:hypothetical protein